MSSNRSVRAGDPFAYAGSRQDREEDQPHEASEAPHACYEGWVYLGFEREDREDKGELVEVFDAVRCWRCHDRRR